MAQKVTQVLIAISVVEKEAMILDCVYETHDTIYYIFWYKGPPSGEMVFLICQEFYNEQNSVNFQKSTSFIGLTITAAQLEDLTVYFCSLRGATVRVEHARTPHQP
jgi:hypothetical protein